MYPSGAGSGGSCTSVGRGYMGTLYFFTKFAANLKISLFKKRKKGKTQSNECSLGKGGIHLKF